MCVRFQRRRADPPRQSSMQHYLVTISTIKKMRTNLSNPILLLYLLLAFAPTGSGQSTKADSSAYLTPKWEAGLDLLGLFNEGYIPKGSVFLRRNYAISKQHCKALRFRIGVDSEIRDGYAFDGVLTGEYATYAPYLSVGHEWKQLFKRHSWYVATDLSAKILYSDQYFLTSGDDKYDDVKIRDFDLALHGVIGYQIHLFRNLSIGVESALVVQYSEQHSDVVDNTMTAFGGDDYTRFTTAIRPFMAVNLIYSLQKHKKNVKN